jgi:hypothetical protein
MRVAGSKALPKNFPLPGTVVPYLPEMQKKGRHEAGLSNCTAKVCVSALRRQYFATTGPPQPKR